MSVTSRLEAPLEFQDDAAALANHIVFQKGEPGYIEKLVAGVLARGAVT